VGVQVPPPTRKNPQVKGPFGGLFLFLCCNATIDSETRYNFALQHQTFAVALRNELERGSLWTTGVFAAAPKRSRHGLRPASKAIADRQPYAAIWSGLGY
jgi:hypothetical protein